MPSRRALLARVPALAAGGLALWLLRDRLPWPAPALRFLNGRSSGWIPLGPGAALIEVPAGVNGRPIRLVIDTGAQFSAIDKALAQEMDLPQTVALPIMAYGVSGQPSLTWMVKLDLTLPGLTVPGLRAAALDLARVSGLTGRGFSMLLGRDVLKGLVLDADLPRGRFALADPETFRPARDATVLPIDLQGGAPMADIRVEGVPLKVLIDTGASGALALSTSAAQAAGLLAPGRPMRTVDSVGLGGLAVDRIVTARTVELGDLAFSETPVQVYAPSAAGAPAGLLGMGLMRRFRATVDLSGRRLVLTRPGLIMVPPP